MGGPVDGTVVAYPPFAPTFLIYNQVEYGPAEIWKAEPTPVEYTRHRYEIIGNIGLYMGQEGT